jgi:hypothetical protein
MELAAGSWALDGGELGGRLGGGWGEQGGGLGARGRAGGAWIA